MSCKVSCIILSLVIQLLTSVYGQRDGEMYCGVCRALVDEINWKIKQIDPKKTVQIGSFRVDPNGNQNTYEIPYARSEIHLTEVFETICEEFKNYAQTTTQDGQKSVTRTSSRDGGSISLQGISMSADIQKKIQRICEIIVEEHEEDIIPLFKNAESNIERDICKGKLGLCSEELMRQPFTKPTAINSQAEKKNVDDAGDDDDDDEDEELKMEEHGEL